MAQAGGLSDVIGAIDGCHIPIKAPRENDSEYINRKGFHSLQIQAVCDGNLMFVDVLVDLDRYMMLDFSECHRYLSTQKLMKQKCSMVVILMATRHIHWKHGWLFHFEMVICHQKSKGLTENSVSSDNALNMPLHYWKEDLENWKYKCILTIMVT